MCQVWDFQCQTREAARSAASAVVDDLVGMIGDAQSSLITASITWWLYLSPVDAGGAPAAQTVQRWMLPFAVVIVTGGVLWQSLLLIINRKGEPLVTIAKGLFTTAIWGAVSLAGTQMLLEACDAYSEWVLTRGMNCRPGIGQDVNCKTDALAERMQFMLTPASPGMAGVLVVLVGLFALLASIAQAMLLLFRSGAVIVLAGMLQLAATGSFTSATSNWLRRVLGWMLALAFYEPFAATTYAVAFMLIGDRRNTDVTTWFTGLAMLGLSIIALPAMMRFFNWTVGAVQNTGSSAGMLAAAGAAGLHAVASQRGAGGLSATDYARDLDRRYDSPRSSGSSPAPTSTPGAKPPSFTGPSPSAPSSSAPVGAAKGTAGGAGAGGVTTAGAGVAGGASGAAGAAAGAGAGTAATAGAAAAAGPAAPIVAGVVAGAKVVGNAARSAADTAARSTGDGSAP